jgi:hypothetical protein
MICPDAAIQWTGTLPYCHPRKTEIFAEKSAQGITSPWRQKSDNTIVLETSFDLAIMINQ